MTMFIDLSYSKYGSNKNVDIFLLECVIKWDLL